MGQCDTSSKQWGMDVEYKCAPWFIGQLVSCTISTCGCGRQHQGGMATEIHNQWGQWDKWQCSSVAICQHRYRIVVVRRIADCTSHCNLHSDSDSEFWYWLENLQTKTHEKCMRHNKHVYVCKCVECRYISLNNSTFWCVSAVTRACHSCWGYVTLVTCQVPRVHLFYHN